MLVRGGLGGANAAPKLVLTQNMLYLVDFFEQFLSCRSSRGSAEPRVPVKLAEQVRLHSSSADTDGATHNCHWALLKSGGPFNIQGIQLELNVGAN